ncbi:hypothetical protein GCM10009719_32380 [Nocardioides kribbensis]
MTLSPGGRERPPAPRPPPPPNPRNCVAEHHPDHTIARSTHPTGPSDSPDRAKPPTDESRRRRRTPPLAPPPPLNPRNCAAGHHPPHTIARSTHPTGPSDSPDRAKPPAGESTATDAPAPAPAPPPPNPRNCVARHPRPHDGAIHAPHRPDRQS